MHIWQFFHPNLRIFIRYGVKETTNCTQSIIYVGKRIIYHARFADKVIYTTRVVVV